MVKTIPVPCTKEEMNALIEAATDDRFYYTLFIVAKTTGRRLSEYYNLKVKDVDFEKNVMMTQVLKRKRYVLKEAILHPKIAKLIRLLVIHERLRLTDYLFRKVSKRQIQYKVAHYAKKAKIKHKVSFHNFRHYFITELVRQGWSYDKIAKLTGHSSLGTLVHYDSSVATDVKDDALIAIESI